MRIASQTSFCIPAFVFVVFCCTLSFVYCTSVDDYEPKAAPGYSGLSVKQTTTGGYIICGYSKARFLDLMDVYVIKTDHSGQEEWSQTYDYAEKESGTSIYQTNDGGYVMCGYHHVNAGLIKTNHLGTIEWRNTFHQGYLARGNHVLQTSDGGYIICGSVLTNYTGHTVVYVIKTDHQGTEEWSRTYGGENDDWGYAIQQTTDGGYIICGETASFGSTSQSYDRNVYLIKIDYQGNEEWAKTYGREHYDGGYSIQQTIDGGYIVTGYSWVERYGSDQEDIYLLKIDATGLEEWSRTFGHHDYNEFGRAVRQTSESGFIICGYADTPNNKADMYVIKTDHLGTTEWAKTFGGSMDDYGYSIEQTTDGGYIVCGDSQDSFVYLVKTDPGGNEEWMANLPH